MAAGKIGLFRRTITVITMIALVFGLSAKPVIAAQAPTEQVAQVVLAGSATSGSGYGNRHRRRCGQAQEQVQELPRVQELPQERAQELVLRVQPVQLQLEQGAAGGAGAAEGQLRLELAQPLQQRVLRALSLASVSAQPLLLAWWVLRW